MRAYSAWGQLKSAGSFVIKVGQRPPRGPSKEVARGRISLGIGGSSAKTDRNQTLGDYGKLNTIFNTGLGIGTSQEATGQSYIQQAGQTLQPSADYYKSLLTAGRTQTAQQSQPAIQATLAQEDAARRQAGQGGTSRTGATVAKQAEAGTQSQGKIDDIINANLMGGKAAGAEGLTKVAGEQAKLGGLTMENAMAALGLGERAGATTLSGSIDSRQLSNQIASEEGASIGNMIGMLALIGMG